MRVVPGALSGIRPRTNGHVRINSHLRRCERYGRIFRRDTQLRRRNPKGLRILEFRPGPQVVPPVKQKADAVEHREANEVAKGHGVQDVHDPGVLVAEDLEPLLQLRLDIAGADSTLKCNG